MHQLTETDLIRYNRQIKLNGWGEAGQQKLKSARVFIAGAGGLGSPVAIYLAVAGVGELRLCDLDRIELSNLNRQVLHPESRMGEFKALSGEKTLKALNPSIEVVAFAERLDESNVDRIVGRPDLMIDCLDNYDTRYLLNDYSLRHQIPMVHGAIWGMSGQVSFLQPPETPCLRCLVPEPPPRETFPVVGVTPGIIGCIQAMEALKYLAGLGDLLTGRLLLFDGEEMSFFSVKVERSADCPACGN
jgi:molybdopterin/thiamine biosynthesis adenylyltransferase